MTAAITLEHIAAAPEASLHSGGLEVIDRFADEWRALCEKADAPQPFYRSEWVSANLRAFARGSQISLLTVRSERDLRLLLPLLQEKSFFSGVPVRKLRAPVNSHSCRFDLSVAPHDAAIEICWQRLRSLNSWDVLEFRSVLEGSAIERLLEFARENGFQTVSVPERPNPIVHVPDDPKLLAQLPLNSRLRTKLRQARRQLSEKGLLRLQRISCFNPAALARFYELEASGWKGTEKSAILCSPQTRQFYDEIAEQTSRTGQFSLYLLEWNDELLAAHFTLAFDGCCYSPKVAYNEKFAEFAPGHLLISEMLQDFVARGIRRYDITGPDDEWKMKWTNATLAMNHHFIFARTPAGRVAYSLRFQVRPVLGKILGRSSGRIAIQK